MKDEIPILIIVFNRIEETKKLLDSLRILKPKKIYVACDGPRKNKLEEHEIVIKVRNLINTIDWDCKIIRKFSEENLGCKINIIEAIDWLFENEEKGIILEDDCIPNKSFIDFCEFSLEKYKNNEIIMHINGSFYLDNFVEIPHSYYYSKISSCWGWATWKRAWSKLERNLIDYKKDSYSGKIFKYYNNNHKMTKWMESYFDDTLYSKSKVWSSYWAYTIMKYDSLCITPTKNLVENIGMNDAGNSNIVDSFKLYGNFKSKEMNSFIHQDNINYIPSYDNLHFDKIISITDPRINENLILRFYKTLRKKIRYLIKGYD